MKPTPFATVPDVESIEPTDSAASYRVVLREASGHRESVVFTVDEGGSSGIPLAASDWDVFGIWPGDAASVRRVVAEVLAFHRGRTAET